MKTLHFLVLLLCVAVTFNGCSLPERKGASVESGNIFVDDTPPSLRIEFPFSIALVKQESRIGGGEGVRIFVTDYLLKRFEKNATIFISRQSIPESDGHFSSFRGADDAVIPDKIFLEKHRNGFCSVSTKEIEDKIFVVITVVRYSARKQADIISIYNFLGNSYNTDYASGKVTENNKPMIEEGIKIAQYLCTQLEVTGLRLKKTDSESSQKSSASVLLDATDLESNCSSADEDGEKTTSCARSLCDESIRKKLADTEGRYRLEETRLWNLKQTRTVQIYGEIYDTKTPGDKSPYYGTYHCTVTGDHLVSASTTKSYFAE